MLVLVADDVSSIRMSLSRLVKKLGHEVIAAKDGKEAWEIMQSQPVEMVISDWMMPEMDGVELCRQIRAEEREKYVYFILVTAREGTDNLVEGMQAGADDFIVKPFNREELRARVRAGQRVLELQSELVERNERLGVAYEQIRKDLEAAATVQQSLLPGGQASIGSLGFDWLFFPSTFVAGDILNYFPLDDRYAAFYSLDVSGHGVPSAMLSIAVHKYLTPETMREIAASDSNEMRYDPVAVVEHLNERFQGSAENMMYFTTVLGIADQHTGEMVLCQAGHPHPLLVSDSGTPKAIGDGGLPVGIVEGASFDRIELTMQPGERLVLYSDGVTDCEDKECIVFGDERFHKVLSKCPSVPMNTVLDNVREQLVGWRGNTEFNDDVSVLAIERQV